MGRVTMVEVAALARVSPKTVSNVMRGHPHVRAEVRERVRLAAAELGYRPDVRGRSLKTGRTGAIALALPDVRLPYFGELAHAVFESAAEVGLHVLIRETGASREGEAAVLSSLEAGVVDGMLYYAASIDSEEVDALRGSLPLVHLGENPAVEAVDSVTIDNVGAAREVAAHLLALGRHRIAFLGHELVELTETSRLRIEGYRAALAGAGVPAPAELLVPRRQVEAAAAADALTAALDAGLEVDALMCRDDLAAIGALQVLHSRGLAVPQDVAVTGWDDIALAAFTAPPLTTVRADTGSLAATAVHLLRERIEGETGPGRHERTIPHRLVVRDSAPSVPVGPGDHLRAKTT